MAAAHEDPQAEVPRFLALHLLEGAVPDGDRKGLVLGVDRLGGVGSGPQGGGDKVSGEFSAHGRHMAALRRPGKPRRSR